MSIALIVSGSIGILAAGIHGAGGELIVVRKLSRDTLPSTRFGGAVMTKTMIHVSWHIATIAFLAVGVALVLSGSVLDGDAAEALGLLGACAFTGFAAIAVGMGAAYTRSPRFLYRHLGPLALTAVAALAWWGAL